MKKLLLSSILMLSASIASFAQTPSSPAIYSSCIDVYLASITVNVNNPTLGSTSGFLWIYISGDVSDPSSYLALSTTTSPALSSTAQYVFNIPAAVTLSYSQCYTVYFGNDISAAPWSGTPGLTSFNLCPCALNGCYYQDPVTTHLMVRVISSAAGPLPFYVWVDPSGGSWPEYIGVTGPGVWDGAHFLHDVDATTGIGLLYAPIAPHNITVNASDAWGVSWPTNTVMSTYNAPPCAYFQGRSIGGSVLNTLTVTAETDYSATSYVFVDETSPIPGSLISITQNPSYPNVPGELPYIVTYDITASVGQGGMSPGPHNFYFTTTQDDPRPNGPVTVISCCDGSKHANTQGTSLPKASSLSIVPNPNSGTFTISGTVQGTATSKQVGIEIVDMLGKTIYSDVAPINNGAVNKNITLDDNFANGIYILNIKTGNTKQAIRFTLDR